MTVPGVVKPGMRVSLVVSDQPDPVDAIVDNVYIDAIGSEVATYTRANGETGIQCTRFLSPADVTDFAAAKALRDRLNGTAGIGVAR